MSLQKNWQVQVQVRNLKNKPNVNLIEKNAKKILNGLASEKIPEETTELSILITDDTEIQKLNASFRGKDSPTDVLSFSLLEGATEYPSINSLGDVVISLETAERQAKGLDVSLDDEVLRLLIHGNFTSIWLRSRKRSRRRSPTHASKRR